MKQGQPALGWVTDLRKQGQKLIAKMSQVPEVVYNAIKQGRYKRVSIELYLNFKHHLKENIVFKNVLKAVALLGVDAPEVNNLEDLEALMVQQLTVGSFDNVASFDSRRGKNHRGGDFF